jgi:hypothetical protein
MGLNVANAIIATLSGDMYVLTQRPVCGLTPTVHVLLFKDKVASSARTKYLAQQMIDDWHMY